MDVLRAIRKGSAVVFTCAWLATAGAAVAGALAPTGRHAAHALVAEVLFGAVAITATLTYIVAALAGHIDDTQWAIGYSGKFLPASSRQPADPSTEASTRIEV